MEDSFATGKSDHIELLQESQSTLGARDGLIQDSMSRLGSVTLEPSSASFDAVKLAMQRLDDRNQATGSERTEATTSDDPGRHRYLSDQRETGERPRVNEPLRVILYTQEKPQVTGQRGRPRKHPRVDDNSLEPAQKKGRNYHCKPMTSDIGINASRQPSLSPRTYNAHEPSHMASNTATAAREGAGDEPMDSVRRPTRTLRNAPRPDYQLLHQGKEPLADYENAGDSLPPPQPVMEDRDNIIEQEIVLCDRDTAIETARRCVSYMTTGNDAANPKNGPSEAEAHAPQPDGHAEEATLPESTPNITNCRGPIIQGFRPINGGSMGVDPLFGGLT
ncbi:hypothetical protein DL764_003622 [Monosporascus ibericus]|uniref:Uncharacterized protein n=1 Tax=Monosporascus ibericus TaxID=155417 RepID=A0A4Q4TJ57_9PEZI|nr:hypothetical protein DL764_003622 [Monosporascus ibericus]